MSTSGDRKAGAWNPRSGDNGLGKGHVAEIQRARIVAAMIDVLTECGLAGSSVAQVVGRSGVSRRTFYEIFEDREHCFLAALDHAIELAAKRVIPAYQSAGCWRDRMRSGLTALLSFLEQEPGPGRLMIVESLGAGPKAFEHRARALEAVIEAVDGGRTEPKAQRALPVLTAEGVVGAVLSVLHARLIDTKRPPPIELMGPLMAMVVLPYLGTRAAERETARPVPESLPSGPVRAGDPLRDLQMRLTYRTIRVLLAIGAQPGASNREVGCAAGIEDQGQTSKLLARLHRLGLLENSGEGQLRGAPNAWTLTEKGGEVEASIVASANRGR